jgi:hypothetical protein
VPVTGSRISLDFFYLNFKFTVVEHGYQLVHFCSSHVLAVSMLKMPSDVQGYLRASECESLVYGRL